MGNHYDDFFNVNNGNYFPNDTNNKNTNHKEEAYNTSYRLLKKRVREMKSDIMNKEKKRNSPNPNMSPYDVVQNVLNALRNSDEPFPNSGYKTLLRFSTPKWREELLRSIGALPNNLPNNNDYIITTALGAALSRPNNQYGILVNEEEGDYRIYFLSDIVDYNDGRCWLECHLVNPKLENNLMIILGWTLERRVMNDGAASWLVDGVDWQDFRDQFRPGIGREEWMRVYG